MALPIQMHHVRTRDPDSRLLKHMHLHGDIGEMLLFLGVCRLHLREMKALPVRPEDVDGHERAVGEKAGLEDRRRTVIDQLARAPHLLVHRGVRQIDENPAGEAVARERSDLRALVEAVLEDLVGLELDGERLVDFPPEELVALDAGGVAGFGEAVRHQFNVRVG